MATYNFEVEDFHTYYVGEEGILVHNACGDELTSMDPSDIRYTQNSIKGTFKDGSSVDDIINGLKKGSISPDDVPAIRVFEKGGHTYSLDN